MWEGDQSVFIPLWASDVSLTRSNDLSHLIQLTSISDRVHHSRKRRLPLADVRGNEARRANTNGVAEGNGGESNEAVGSGHSGLAEMREAHWVAKLKHRRWLQWENCWLRGV